MKKLITIIGLLSISLSVHAAGSCEAQNVNLILLSQDIDGVNSEISEMQERYDALLAKNQSLLAEDLNYEINKKYNIRNARIARLNRASLKFDKECK